MEEMIKTLKEIPGKKPYKGYLVSVYDTKQGIKIAQLKHVKTGKRIQMRYPRYLMSIHLGRILDINERVRLKVGHEDDIKFMSLEKRLSKGEKEALKAVRALGVDRVCVICGTEFKAKLYNKVTCSDVCRDEKQKRDIAAWRVKNKKEKVYHYSRHCVVCETPFKTNNRTQELCGNKACRAVISRMRYD